MTQVEIPVDPVAVTSAEKADVSEQGAVAKQSRCRRMFLPGIIFLAVIAGVAVAVVLVLNGGDSKVPVSLKFVATTGSSSSVRRHLLDSAVSAADVSVTVNELSYAVGTIKLCKEIVEDWYTWGGQEYVMYVPDHSTCTTVADYGEMRPSSQLTPEEQCEEAQEHFMNNKYVNFADQASLDTISVTEAVLPGSYKFAEITFNGLLRVRASAELSDGTQTHTIHTKACGISTCGSVCIGEATVRDCRGTITDAAEFSGVAFGDTNSLGDIWTAAPFPSIAANENLPGTDSGGYWRRCEHDMSVGEAEAIYTVPQNNEDAIVVQFLEPLEVEASETGETELTLELAVDVEGLVGGKVKPFNSWTGGLGPTNHYGVSDGFLGFTLQSATIAPVILQEAGQAVKRYEYSIWVRKTGVPYCMSGTDAFGKDGVPNGSGKCHPCHLFEKECKQGGSVVNDAEFSTAGLEVEQEFDLKLSLFYQTGGGGAVGDISAPRSASVVRKYNPQLPVTQLLDEIFWVMRVEAIAKNAWDGKLSFWENMFGGGRFPRIRDFQPLSAVGEVGSTKVMVGAGGQQVFVEVATTLTKIVTQS